MTSVIADIISSIEPKLIITEGNNVFGYKHLIPIDTPITRTYAIVYGNGMMRPTLVVFWVTTVVEFVLLLFT